MIAIFTSYYLFEYFNLRTNKRSATLLLKRNNSNIQFDSTLFSEHLVAHRVLDIGKGSAGIFLLGFFMTLLISSILYLGLPSSFSLISALAFSKDPFGDYQKQLKSFGPAISGLPIPAVRLLSEIDLTAICSNSSTCKTLTLKSSGSFENSAVIDLRDIADFKPPLPLVWKKDMLYEGASDKQIDGLKQLNIAVKDHYDFPLANTHLSAICKASKACLNASRGGVNGGFEVVNILVARGEKFNESASHLSGSF